MLKELKQEFNRPAAEFVPIVSAGLIGGIVTFVKAVLLAALVFSGNLTPFLPEGIGITLFTSMVIALIAALTSSMRGTAAFIQEAPVGVLALMALHVSGRLDDPSSDQAFITVLTMLTMTSLLAGLVFLGLWRFKLGNLIRFIPYPVTGGFLAATGLILVQGAITVMTDQPFEILDPGHIFAGDLILRWLPGAVFGFVLLLLMRRYTNPLITPGMLALAVIVFLIGVQVAGSTLQEAQNKGWLIGPFPEGKTWQPFFLYDLGSVQWSAIIQESSHIPVAVTITVIGMLLNVTGIEAATQRDLDMDQELRSVGIGNLVSAAGGGMIGFPSMSSTMLGHRMGVASRLQGVVMAIFFGVVMLAGPSLVAQFPKVVLGGLLLYLGLSMMSDWVYDGLFTMQRGDYVIILIIVMAVAIIGYLEGIVIGIAAAMILFVVDYSRLNVIRSSYSGVHFHSKSDRPLHHRRQLQEAGESLHIFHLEGYLFFGTANTLLNRITERQHDPHTLPLNYLILDFSRLRRLDSSAIQSFSKIRHGAESHDYTLILCGISEENRRIIQRSGFDLSASANFREMEDSDQALEWCEERILREARATSVLRGTTLRDHIDAIFPGVVLFDDLMAYLDRIEIGEGEYLAHQGDVADAMYFVESGRIRIQLEAAEGNNVRLRTVREGAILGEVGIYSEAVRSASMVADQESVVFRLPVDSLRRMEAEDQALATAFHKFIAHVLAERLSDTTQALDAALR